MRAQKRAKRQDSNEEMSQNIKPSGKSVPWSKETEGSSRKWSQGEKGCLEKLNTIFGDLEEP